MTKDFLKYLVLAQVLILGLSGFAQNLRNDIAKINANYSTEKSFKLQMTISLLKNDKEVESNTYNYLQHKSSSLFKIGKISTIVLDDFLLVIDERVQNIILSSSSIGNPFKVSGSYDSLLDLAKSYKFEVLDSGKKNKYTLIFKKSIYKKIEIIFNPNNYQLNLVKIYYTNKKKKEPTKVLQFLYGVSERLSATDKIKLNKNTYLIQSDNKIKLAPRFKNYDLIDYRSFYQE